MPNWYDKNLRKHWKDYGQRDYGHQVINLWHISPEKVVYPSAKSSFQGVSGIYFSPSYKSLIKDWAMYVAGKRQVKDGLEDKFLSLFDREEEVIEEHRSGKRPGKFEYDPEYIKINEEIERLREIREKKEYRDAHKAYQFLYINKFIFPEWTMKEINEWFFGKMEYEETNIGDRKIEVPKNLGFWSWGEQIFVPQKYFKYLKFIFAKKMSLEEIVELNGRM